MSNAAGSDIKERVREQFAGSGDAYRTSVGHRMGKDLPQLIALASAQQHTRALDVATGGGHTAAALMDVSSLVVPFDLTPHMLNQTRELFAEQGLPAPPVVAGDAEDLPFADQVFDLVTCRIAPHHFPNVRRAMEEIGRVLTPGGQFLLIDSVVPADPALDAFINTLEKRRDPSHVRSHTLDEWVEFVTSAGLAIEHTEVIHKRHQFPDWTARTRMVPDAKQALNDWVIASDLACKSYFQIEEQDGQVLSFLDEKLLLAARKVVDEHA